MNAEHTRPAKAGLGVHRRAGVVVKRANSSGADHVALPLVELDRSVERDSRLVRAAPRVQYLTEVAMGLGSPIQVVGLLGDPRHLRALSRFSRPRTCLAVRESSRSHGSPGSSEHRNRPRPHDARRSRSIPRLRRAVPCSKERFGEVTRSAREVTEASSVRSSSSQSSRRSSCDASRRRRAARCHRVPFDRTSARHRR